MTPLDAPELLHVVGYLTGVSLYAMLLAMVVRTGGPAYRLTLGTAVLGLAWNVGELTAHLFETLGLAVARDWMAGVSYAALGFLAAVVVHSAARRQQEDAAPQDRRTSRFVVPAAYSCAALAALMQLFAAMTGRALPWSAGLMLLTTGLTALAVILLVTARDQPEGRRTFWMLGLALFAVSALHLSSFHGATEGWLTELLGHHASIPLAFAILYQDYRFAFADVFLKRAVTLLALVACVFIGWSAVAPFIATDATVSPAVGALIAMWVGTALLFPWLRRQVTVFVDRVVLKRADYATVLDGLTSTVQSCDAEQAVLDHTCTALAPALSAASVTWRANTPAAGIHEVPIPTADAPRPTLTIGRLTGGRRLLSDDLMLLERVAHLVGRRIDTLRLGDERYERMLREREISTLAAQAELRALRAQINPHFLFNALTTLGYLIQSAPSRAVDTLMRLTTLLRSALRSEGEFTTLGHELDLIECYLEIERERFEERLQTRLEISPRVRQMSIPALVVQPLVENAIKHGIAGAREGGRVIVSADVPDEPERFLEIVVRNTGAPLGAPSSTAGMGIGLQNVANRLRCYYGDDATLRVSSNASGETVAEVRIPLHTVVGDEEAPALVERTRS
jgi:two-component system LytT family sensor kinase